MLRLLWPFLAISLVQTALAEQPPNPLQSPSTAVPGEIKSRSVVFDYGNYDPYDRANLYGFNHAPSVTRVDGKRIQAAWFSGPYEGSIHQVILGAASEDGGHTWGEAMVLNDAPRLSDFDPGFIDAGDRTLLFFSTGRWTRYPFVGHSDSERKEVGGRSFKINMRQRPDGAVDWSDPIDIGSEPGWNCRSNGFQMSTGELLLPTHRLDPLPYVASVLISSDDGKTWVRGPDIKTPGNIGAAEPSVAELPGGTLVMSLRVTDGRVWLARSDDHGRTWSEPERTELSGAASSSNLFCPLSGRLLLTYNSSEPLRSHLSLCASDDAGKSWTEPLLLARFEPPSEVEEVYSRQVCYPSVCELEDGDLLIVWAKIEVGRKLQSGVIESAIVRLHEDTQ
ncbi:MAG: sialidase family protein [Pirellulales bacterium]